MYSSKSKLMFEKQIKCNVIFEDPVKVHNKTKRKTSDPFHLSLSPKEIDTISRILT